MNELAGPDPGPDALQGDLEALLAAARSTDADERFEAVSDLTFRAEAEAAKALIQAVFDSDADVSAAALEGLAARGHPEARALVIGELGRRRPAVVRHAALRAAGMVDISPHLDGAWKALEHRAWVVRATGASALARAGQQEAAERIAALGRQALDKRDPAPAAHLLGAAALLGHAASQDAFLARLAGRGEVFVKAALYFLSRGDRATTLAAMVGKGAILAAIEAARRHLTAPFKGRRRKVRHRALRNVDEILTKLA